MHSTTFGLIFVCLAYVGLACNADSVEGEAFLGNLSSCDETMRSCFECTKEYSSFHDEQCWSPPIAPNYRTVAVLNSSQASVVLNGGAVGSVVGLRGNMSVVGDVNAGRMAFLGNFYVTFVSIARVEFSACSVDGRVTSSALPTSSHSDMPTTTKTQERTSTASTDEISPSCDSSCLALAISVPLLALCLLIFCIFCFIFRQKRKKRIAEEGDQLRTVHQARSTGRATRGTPQKKSKSIKSQAKPLDTFDTHSSLDTIDTIDSDGASLMVNASSATRIYDEAPKPKGKQPVMYGDSSLVQGEKTQPLMYGTTNLLNAQNSASESNQPYGDLKLLWECSNCSNMNSADTMYCFKCDSLKH